MNFTPVELETLVDAVVERVADHLSNQRRLLSRQELAPIVNVSLPKMDSVPCWVNSSLGMQPHAEWLFAWHLAERAGDACIL